MAKAVEKVCSGKAFSKELQKGGIQSRTLSLKDEILTKYSCVKNLKEKASRSKDWEAQNLLSKAYEYGVPELNIQKDLDSAIEMLESSMRNGNYLDYEKCCLGTLYDTRGTIPDQRRAFDIYLECALKGVVQAELSVAEVYRCGIEGVVNKDLEEAFKWYRCAAGEESSDNVDVKFNSPEDYMKSTLKSLGIDFKIGALKTLHECYMIGDCPEGEPQPIKALYYLKKAAELGDSEAQRDLGLSYLEGERGQPKDANIAKRWLKKAASNDDKEAKEVLEKFAHQNIVEDVVPEPDEAVLKSNFQQYKDILNMAIKENHQWHPYIQNPNFPNVYDFDQFPDSPTAQHFSKAYELLQKGLEKIANCSESDESLMIVNPDFEEGIKLLAHSFLNENSILASSLDSSSLKDLILEKLNSNPNFFEGLLLLFAIYPVNKRFNVESCKVDLKRTMFLNNIIHLIKKAEPNMPPTQDPYSFDQNYSSWLHQLYYLLGSNYIIAKCLKDGAEAFQNALECCPTFSEAKLPLGHCLLLISLKDKSYAKYPKQKDLYESSHDELLLEIFAKPKDQRIFKGDFLTWTKCQLRQKAKQLFLEYLDEVPECDKKYPEGHYHMAYLCYLERRKEEALKWKERGEDSEERRLPFMLPLKSALKECLRELDLIQIPKKSTAQTVACHNPCQSFPSHSSAMKQSPSASEGSQRDAKQPCTYCSKTTGELKQCPCKNVSYCGSDCQKADWKEHKKTCTSKRKDKRKHEISAKTLF